MATKPALTEKARGILLIIAAVSCFGAVDGFSKILVDTQSFGQIIRVDYGFGNQDELPINLGNPAASADN